jgi:hypothetical protein
VKLEAAVPGGRRGLVGAASTKLGRLRTAGWVGPGERDGKVYARNRCRYASSGNASSNPVDVGWFAVQTCPRFRAGNSWFGIALWDREATVKVYGVAVAMPQG